MRGRRLEFLIILVTIFIITSSTAYAQVDENAILKISSEGEEVVNLQMRLKDLGYFNYKVTGYYGGATLDAVRYFQEKNELQVDGTVGPDTKAVLYSDNAKRCTIISSNVAGILPASRGGRSSYGKTVDWFTEAQYIYPRGSTAKVIDLDTGTTFYMKRTGGSYHADAEPVSKEDTAKIKQVWGGWSWKRRAVIVEIDGVRLAASMHGMPHAYQKVTNNGMNGHVCIHFYKSRTHVHNREDAEHQAMVLKASGK